MPDFPIPGLDALPGFLTPSAASLLDGLSRLQVAEGIRGDIAEIGVFYGRSALVLGRTLAEAERLVACDTFEVGAGDVPGWAFASSGPPEEALRRWWSDRVGDPDGLAVIRGDSGDLTADDLGRRRCRLVHVDGGHAYAAVRHDAALADEALQPAGAIVFDDMMLAEWPDVTVAVIDHLREDPDRLVPILLAENKGVFCRPDAAPLYRAWAEETARALFPSPRHLVIERGFLGHTMLVVSRLTG